MKWTSLTDIREQYLKFFESKNHLRLTSASLVPDAGDKSLLLINSGMAPLKKYFTGEISPPSVRATSCQKCLRTTDIERVGKTARHGSFFEMLGNFSFGDYFKEDATKWAWEFMTEVMEMPSDKLWISVYEEDDETAQIWVDKVGIDPSHIVRLGKEDNFWEHGTGPCGPCSELYFDRGVDPKCTNPNCAVGCDCDRFVEVWNLVFTQFSSDGKGNYTPLEHKNIDTGMGLERIACVMQGVDSLFEVDTVRAILDHAAKIAKVEYKKSEKFDMSLRVITDHIRAMVFLIADGVIPSNEGRGYALRRLIRRAARHGKLLGINKTFLSEIAITCINENKLAYPEIEAKREYITKLINVEEQNFGKTIDAGLSILKDMIDKVSGKTLSGEHAFLLYDTYGFPLDLTKDILEEHGIAVDETAFVNKMTEQVERARAARKGADIDAWVSKSDVFANISATKFCGYETLECSGKILAVVQDGQPKSFIDNNNDCILVLDKTPFYAESGGQCGDRGEITINGATFEVTNTKKTKTGVFLHMGSLLTGSVSVNDTATSTVYSTFRDSVKRSHTSAHLLQYALRNVLGNHVEQAGQSVSDSTIRFDFTHFSAIQPQELKLIEQTVNQLIFDAIDVKVQELPIDELKSLVPLPYLAKNMVQRYVLLALVMHH